MTNVRLTNIPGTALPGNHAAAYCFRLNDASSWMLLPAAGL